MCRHAFMPNYVCGKDAKRVEFSIPGQPILYGEGFYKPAASGALSYTRQDPDKAAKEHIQSKGGARNMIKQIRNKS